MKFLWSLIISIHFFKTLVQLHFHKNKNWHNLYCVLVLAQKK